MDGWKTYVCAALAVIVLGLRAAGESGVIPWLAHVPAQVWEFILYALGFGGMAALRQAVAKAASAPFDGPELPRGQ
jgi:hypothetical protein